MAKDAHSQYTIRRVPRSVDRALRRIARERGVSLNAMLLDVVTRASGAGAEPPCFTDLDELIGSWISDPATERALAEQRRVDPRDWE